MTDKPSGALRDYPGINVAYGLKYINGNEKLYVTLLGKFSAQFKEAAQEIADFAAAGERAEAARAAHSVKGLGASLGLAECSAAAAALEESIKANDDQFSALLGSFKSELNKATDSIGVLTADHVS